MATRRMAAVWLLLIVLSILALWSIRWGTGTALRDSADLVRRGEEVRLFLDRVNPYSDPDCTYPPSALPVFAALLGPIPDPLLSPVYLVLNLAALGAVGLGLVRLRAQGWRDPVGWCLLAWCLACRPVRAGLALGQFHLIPVALALATLPCLARGRTWWAGLLLGLALTKPTMVYPVVIVWLFTGHGRAVAVALGVQVMLALAASAWLGEPPLGLMHDWVSNARGQLEAGTIDFLTVTGMLGAGGGLRIVGTLAVLALSVVLLWLARRAPLGHQTALALGLAAVGTYHRHYDLGLLLPMVVVLLGDRGSALVSSTNGRPSRSWAERMATGEWLVAVVLALVLLVPTNPSWIRPFTPLIEGVVIASSYLAIGFLALRCGRWIAPGGSVDWQGDLASTPKARTPELVRL